MERRRFDPHTHRGAAGPSPPIAREPKPVALSHPEAVEPTALYRLRQIHPPRVVGGDPEIREVEVEGSMLVDMLLGANRFPARVVGPRVLAPVLDVFNGTGGPLLWINVNDLRAAVESGGFVALSADGHVLNYGKHPASALTGRVWSAWRRKAEAEGGEGS